MITSLLCGCVCGEPAYTANPHIPLRLVAHTAWRTPAGRHKVRRSWTDLPHYCSALTTTNSRAERGETVKDGNSGDGRNRSDSGE